MQSTHQQRAFFCALLCCMCASADPEQFTVENDCITPTFKFKRPQLLKRYQVEIDNMYRSLRGNSCVSSYAPSRAVSRATSLATSNGPSRAISRATSIAASKGEVEVPRVFAKAH